MSYTIRTAIFALGLLSAAALAFAIGAEKLFGYAPCELCLIQRYWHGVVVTAAVVLIFVKRPRLCLTIQTGALVICFGYALFHVGVEQHWWHGLQACTGATGATTIEDLRSQILNAPVVRCDEIRWAFLGLSMAVYNALLTGLMAAFAIFTGFRKR